MEYFDLEFDFLEGAINQEFLTSFFQTLEKLGLHFMCGYRDGEGLPFEQLIDVVQKQLTGEIEDANKYYQFLFSFYQFSFVRGYWHCVRKWYSEKVIFRFNLIIPEEDFMDETASGEILKKTEAMDVVKAFAIEVWNNTDVCAIQTAWEFSNVPPDYYEIESGIAIPQVEPFAVMPSSVCSKDDLDKSVLLSRNGILLENAAGWVFSM